MDLILQDFLEHSFSSLSPREKMLFDKILDETDLDIMDWILGRTQPDNSEYEALIHLFRQAKTE